MKMYELALKLKDIAETINFESKYFDEIQKLQERVVEIIFNAVNMITFQRDGNDALTKDGKHTRARKLYCGDDIGQFACGGQGHCHTVSSTMAGILLPWCHIFGIDLKYRESASKSHQWLELTFRPSNKSVIVDLYREDKERSGKFINQPIEDAECIPSLRLNKFSEKQVQIEDILETDFED